MGYKKEERKSRLYFHRESTEKLLKKLRKYPITALSAPMGYGKTVLVKNYLLDRKATACWLSLGRADNSPKYFWDKLIHSIMRVRSDVGDMIDLGFPDNDEKFAQVFNMFMKSIHSNRERYVVLDNYHVINNPKIHELLQYIAQELIDGLHIILIMRGAVPGVFTEMIVNNMMGIISTPEFEFSAEEVRQFFRFNEIEITPEQASVVRRNTWGWITAIYLVLLAYREDGNLNRIPSNLEALVDATMYSKFDRKTQEILMKLSILDIYSREAAAYISETPDAGSYIDALVESNSFVRFNPKTNCYIIHPVLRVLLRRNLKTKHGGELQAITKRAGDYLLTHESGVRGLHMLNKADDYEGIAEVLKKNPFSFWNQLDTEELISIFNGMPAALKQTYFIVYLRFLLFLALNNRFVQAQQLVTEAWDIYRNSRMSGSDTEGRLQGEILLVEATCCAFHPGHALRCLRQADALLAHGSTLMNKKVFFPSECISPFAVAYEAQGRLEEARDMCIEMSKYKFRLSHGLYCTGGSELCRAEYHYLRGELHESAPLFFLALHNAQSNGDDITSLRCAFFLMQIFITNGESDKISALNEDQQLSGEASSSETAFIYNMFRAAVAAAMGDLNTLEPLNAAGEALPQTFARLEPSWNCLMTAGVAVAMQKWHEVIKLCMKMKANFSKRRKILGQIYTNIFEAIATLRLYTTDFAKIYLETALRLAETDGIIMPFAEYAENIFGLLQLIQPDETLSREFLNCVTQLCRRRMDGLAAISKKMSVPKPSEFTPREKELMRNLINCESNKEIAYNMGVKIGTIKKMMYNVFQKLDVNCRSGAVKKIISCKIEI